MLKFWNSKALFIIAMALFAMAFYSIQKNSPLWVDEFDFFTSYHQTENGEWQNEQKVITEPSQILTAYDAHRDRKNGRIADFFAIASLNLIGKDGFAVVNTVMALLFVLVYTKLFLKEWNLTNLSLLCISSFLILIDVHQTVFWVAGACNYFWGAVFLGLFIWQYDRLEKVDSSKLALALCCFTALFTASIHEQLGFSIVGMLGLHALYKMIINKRFYLDKTFVVGLFAFVGAASTLMSSAIWHRIDGEVGHFSILGLLFHSGISLLCLFVYIWKFRGKAFQNTAFYYAIAAFVLLLCLNQSAQRAAFYVSLGALMLMLQVFETKVKQYAIAFSGVSLALLAVCIYPIYIDYATCSRYLREVLATPASQRTIVIDTTSNPDITACDVVYRGIMDNSRFHPALTVWGRKSFVVIFNALVKDRSVYQAFQDIPATQTAVIETDGKSIVRLPKGICPLHNRRIDLVHRDTKRIIWAQSYICKRGKLRHLIGYIKPVDKIVRFARDFDGEYYYLVFSETLGHGYDFSIPCLDESEKKIDFDIAL